MSTCFWLTGTDAGVSSGSWLFSPHVPSLIRLMAFLSSRTVCCVSDTWQVAVWQHRCVQLPQWHLSGSTGATGR